MGCKPVTSRRSTALNYPVPHKVDVVDDYHGTTVADPFRWMEALDSKDVAGWVAASNAVTESYLKTLPLRQHFNTRLTELWNYPRVSVPVNQHGRLFYSKNSGLQRQAPVFMRAGIAAAPELVIDPNTISPDGSVSLAQWSPSPDARLLAYALSEGGADWQTIRVRNIASATDLSDEVRWMRFSDLSWTKDSKSALQN
jgi:prolyl oligopeptidase